MPKIVIVGASRGIGKSLIPHLAGNADMEIHVLSRNEPSNIGDFANAYFHSFDLTSNSVRNDASLIFQEIGNIDFVINNAGNLVNKPFTEITPEELITCYNTNVLGVFQTVQALVPFMLDNGGHIVNISSMGGFQGSVKFAGLSAYSTSKAAICSFTELFSEEYKESKIAMNCLCLGAVQTEMLEEAFPGYEAPLSADEMARYIADFTLTGHRFFKGKILPVSLSTP